jgi:starch phosphorylase
MATICPVFNTNRMVQEYMERFYVNCAERFNVLTTANLERARRLAKWRQAVSSVWPSVRVEQVQANGADPMHVGAKLEVQARVNLGSLKPDDVQVQLYHGIVDNHGEISSPSAAAMSHNGAHDGNTWIFKGAILCRSSGQHGFAVRVLPKHEDLANPFEPGLVCWG